MPGCLGLDALWQMLGFFLGWLGAPGRGRALGVGEIKFTGMVVPGVKRLEYIVDLKRVIRRKLVLGIGDGILKADGGPIYSAKDLKATLLQMPIWACKGPERLGPWHCRLKKLMRIVGQSHETCCCHRNGHRLVHREQHPGSAVLPCAKGKSGIVRAKDYAERGFRCQVHGAPVLELGRADRPQGAPLHGRRRWVELHRHAAGDCRFGAYGERGQPRADRARHGLRRPIDPRHRAGGGHDPRERPAQDRPVRGAQGDVEHELGHACHALPHQGRRTIRSRRPAPPRLTASATPPR